MIIETNYICILNKEQIETLNDFDYGNWKYYFYKDKENYHIKIWYNSEIPELHIGWLVDLNLFKHVMNIFDKMKVNIYFIIADLEYLLTKKNDFEEILKELDFRLDFKIYCEWILFQFRNCEYSKLLDKENKTFIEIYKKMIKVCSNILILNFKSTESCFLNKMLEMNKEVSESVLNSEDKKEDKKRWIYYKQWVFEIDEILNVNEELLYSNY